jgi:hypothetical protein
VFKKSYVLENREYGRRDLLHWPRNTLCPQKMALTRRQEAVTPVQFARRLGPRSLFACFVLEIIFNAKPKSNVICSLVKWINVNTDRNKFTIYNWQISRCSLYVMKCEEYIKQVNLVFIYSLSPLWVKLVLTYLNGTCFCNFEFSSKYNESLLKCDLRHTINIKYLNISPWVLMVYSYLKLHRKLLLK